MKKMMVVLVALVSVGLWVSSAKAGATGRQPKPDEQKEHQHGDEEHHPHAPQHKLAEADDAPMGATPVGPELKKLEYYVGKWTVEHKMWMVPDSEPMVSQGTEINRMILGGRAMSTMFECCAGPERFFRGHALTTWNVQKQKYHGVWVDVSSRNGFDISWGTCDEKGENWKWDSEMTAPDGTPAKLRMVDTKVDQNHHHFVTYMTGPDGKEFKYMEFNYTRAK